MAYNVMTTIVKYTHLVVPTIKYIVVIGVLLCIFFTPAYLAAANGKTTYKTFLVRFASWLFNWSFVGWFVALFMASSKK